MTARIWSGEGPAKIEPQDAPQYSESPRPERHSLEAESLRGEGHLGGQEGSSGSEYDPFSDKESDLTRQELLILLWKVSFSSSSYQNLIWIE